MPRREAERARYTIETTSSRFRWDRKVCLTDLKSVQYAERIHTPVSFTW